MSTADAKLPTAPRIEGRKPHLLVVRAPYYTDVVDGLRDGATRLLAEAGAAFDVLDVSGALELSGAIRLAVRGTRPFDGYVALGCVVRGETDHYDHVCREAMSGLTQVTLQFGLCLGNGLLTVHTVEQAVARSRLDGHNKGAEAAAAALVQIRASRWLGVV
ncbi:6,7-dimethyl-8-ribityllumazine synthase [Rhodovastum atsumiense]|uniref:6,7-dimethyl-8-ribityllumazine synthase n=1 Tax=Rhodovastum atsumiense TaxID=504468 RepID=A0A5M6IL11_9PROT|nr:6,7-dimethyl-8-ribityllumazine synthase [Rhodovastum atsumiense]KAA5608862.1 6,7-dimethyl-8-ribityllumazine synthase [Rhodovastum atsumiense]CAH2599308.1 6,7-dimethyl-8-ribityllumazine synthase [Rhodovastum atsumiense]